MGEHAPEVLLIDARETDLDEQGLRGFARALEDAAGSGATSRSYRHPLALVAFHDAAVGVDIERIEPCDAAFADTICTPAERADPRCHQDPDRFLSNLWSSKEALSKALGDALDYDPRHLDSPLFWPEGAAGPWRAAPLAVPSGHVAWVCWRRG